MLFKKKGQLSLFIVLAAIIVVAGITYFSFQKDIPFFADQSPTQKIVNNIETYVESCLQKQTSKGIRKLGQTGGWIYTKTPLLYSRYIDPDVLAKKSQGYEDVAGVEHPYWEYYDEGNEIFKQNVPTYDEDGDAYSMEAQLQRYVSETLNTECLQDFKPFESVADLDYSLDDLEVNVNFDEELIKVSLDLPLLIQHKNIETIDTLTSYNVELDNKLQVPYHLAIDIANSEFETSFLEKGVLALMEVHMDLNGRDLLPPRYETVNEYDFKPWFIPDVKRTTQQILESFISIIQLSETNPKPMKLPEELREKLFLKGILKTFQQNYLGSSGSSDGDVDYSITRAKGDRRSLSIFNSYKDYTAIPSYSMITPFVFSIQQAKGGVVLFPDAQMLLSFPLQVAITTYEASYSLSAPIVYNIRSKNPNDDFVFSFPLEINIKNNNPLKEQPWFVDRLNSIDFPLSDSYQDSLICNPAQFVTEPVKLSLVDPIYFGKAENGDGYGVDGAMVEFVCKNQLATCFLGTTQIIGDETNLSIRLPENCDPSTLKISKFGHKSVEINNIVTSLTAPVDLGVFEMPSKKKLKLSFGSINWNAPTPSNLKDSLIPLDDGETGILILENLEDENVVEVVQVTPENQRNLSISLLPGTYSVLAFVISEDEDHVIHSSVIKGQDGGLLGIGATDDVELPEINLSIWVTSQYNLPEFKIKTSDLIENDVLVIPAISYGFPTTYGGLEDAGEVKDLEKHSRNKKPKFCTQTQVNARQC